MKARSTERLCCWCQNPLPVGRGLRKLCSTECKKKHAVAKSRKWVAENPERHAEHLARWYNKKRKNNPEWSAENKRIAKAWRERNSAHVKAYRRAHYAAATQQQH